MENFQKSLKDCNLSDIDFEGFPFTWSRKNGNGSVLWERLNRVVANTEFRHLWYQTKVHHLNSNVSAHKPIPLTLISQNINDDVISARKRIFHFETMWLKEEGFEDVVKDAQEYNVDEHLSVKEKLKSPKVPDQMKHFFAKPYSRDRVCYEENASFKGS
ncbi:unnamed protein product [Prunus brigantina]